MRDELKTELRQVLRRSGCEEEFIKDRTNEVLAIFDKVEDLREKITADVRSEFTIAKSIKITKLSPFISETVEIDGLVLSREDFIPRNYRSDPLYDDKQLLLNTINGHWQLQSKTKGPQFVSSVEVYCSLIVGAIKPGMCYATLVFIKGKSSPLVFFDGDFSEKNIIAELELEDKSLKNKYVAEAFRRSLMVCPYVFFFPILSHVGWNITPDGLRIFVSSALDVPLLGRLFGDEKKRIRNIFSGYCSLSD